MNRLIETESDIIEDIWIFQCKIEFYFTEWTPNAVFSRVAVATSENNKFGCSLDLYKSPTYIFFIIIIFLYFNIVMLIFYKDSLLL